MMTQKERYLTLVEGGKPDGFVNQYDFVHLTFQDPLMNMEKRVRGKDIICPWGCTIRWPEKEPFGIIYNSGDAKVCKDIEDWKEYIHAPTVDVPDEDWIPAQQELAAVNQDEQLRGIWSHTGIFERYHFLLGFEDALCSFYEYPDEAGEILDYITDWRIQFYDRVFKHLDVDLVFFHDDLGSRNSTFLAPELFNEFLKPRYKRLFDYIKSNGKRVIHHSDSFFATSCADMREAGAECWQGVLPSNNIPELQKQKDKVPVLMGGFESAILDRPDTTEEAMRAHVAEVCQNLYAGGHWIPCITNGDPALAFNPGGYEIVHDEISKQSQLIFGNP